MTLKSWGRAAISRRLGITGRCVVLSARFCFRRRAGDLSILVEAAYSPSPFSLLSLLKRSALICFVCLR